MKKYRDLSDLSDGNLRQLLWMHVYTSFFQVPQARFFVLGSGDIAGEGVYWAWENRICSERQKSARVVSVSSHRQSRRTSISWASGHLLLA